MLRQKKKMAQKNWPISRRIADSNDMSPIVRKVLNFATSPKSYEKSPILRKVPNITKSRWSYEKSPTNDPSDRPASLTQ